MHEYKAKLSSARNRSLESFARVWRASKVELKGGYSIQRLRALSQYCDNNSSKPFRAAAIMLVTPLPCLGAILLADSLPLSPPGQGIVHNKVFWLRAFVGAWFFTISFVVQFSQSLPMLSMTRRRVFVITWVVSIGGTAVVMALSLAVGFPMPFMMVLATPGWIAFLVGSLAVQWGSAIRANPSVWPMVLNCLKVFSIQMSLLVVYPVYNYFFQKLRGTEQALFSLVLHIIKIGAKNAIGRYFTHMEDMRPEVVIFNVEVFSALFTSFCMQNATSLLTTLILVVSDFIHACSGLRDLNQMLRELSEAREAMTSSNVMSASFIPVKGCRGGSKVRGEHEVEFGNPPGSVTKSTQVESERGVLAHAVGLLERSGAFISSPRQTERIHTRVAGPHLSTVTVLAQRLPKRPSVGTRPALRVQPSFSRFQSIVAPRSRSRRSIAPAPANTRAQPDRRLTFDGQLQHFGALQTVPLSEQAA